MRIANYFYPCLGLLTILRYSIQGLGYSNLSILSGVMEMIARCGVSLWLVPALAWTGVCFGAPVAWVMADLFLIPAFRNHLCFHTPSEPPLFKGDSRDVKNKK